MSKRKPKSVVQLERWDDLSLFLAVVRAKSFTRAAQELRIEQSTVSRRIAALEASLKMVLFERSTKRATLTPAGESLVRRAEAIESEVLALCDEASQYEREIEGHVRLALTESIAVYGLFPKLLGELQREHPKLTLELITSYRVANLGHRDAELALRFFRPTDGDLVAQKVATMETSLIGHRCLQERPLRELPTVAVSLDGIPTVEADYIERHLSQKPTLITTSYLVQIEAVRAGLGAALLPTSLLSADPALVQLGPRLPQGPTLELWLVAPRTLRKVPRIDAVWTALERGLAAIQTQAQRRKKTRGSSPRLPKGQT